MFSTIDVNGLLWLNNVAHTNVVTFWAVVVLSRFLIALIIIAPLFIIEVWHDARRDSMGSHVVVQAVFAVILATAVGYLIGALVGRPRPFMETIYVAPIGPLPAGLSFPSAHSWVAFAFASAFLYYPKYAKIGRILVVFAAFVALGRVMAGVHYPSDVVVGSMLGLASAYVVAKWSKPLFRWMGGRNGYSK